MSSVLDMQVYALLGRLGAEREESCRSLIAEAEAQAAEQLADARKRARQRVRWAVREKRERVADHCRRVRVDLETQRRDRDFQCLSAALQAGLARLPAVIEARWRDPAARQRWCEAAVADAARVLGRGGWRVEHARGPVGDERDRLASLVAARGGDDGVLVESPALRAGLRILLGGASYDASLEGLVAQRAQLEAALLAEIAALTAGEASS
jgi:hypothetical protein